MPDNKDLGAQMADILTARLSVEDAFQLVERAKLGKVIEEQKLKLVGLADQDKAVEVGKLLGAQRMVIGKTFMMDKQLWAGRGRVRPFAFQPAADKQCYFVLKSPENMPACRQAGFCSPAPPKGWRGMFSTEQNRF